MNWARDFYSDLRSSVRGLSRNPGFCAVAILTIALGVGANTAVFGLARKVLLENLPVVRPDELVELDCIDTTNPEEGQCDASWPGFRMYEESATLLSGLFAYSAIADLNVVHQGASRMGSALLASGRMYEVLGVAPLHGRLLQAGDDERAAPLVAVLGHRFWRDHFSSDPAIVGQTIRLNDRLATVIGITPPAFRGVILGEPPDITLPMGAATDVFLRPGTLDSGTNWWLRIMGRRMDGVTNEQLQTALAPVFQRTVEHMIASAGSADGPRYREFLRNYEFRVREAAGGGFSELRSELEQPLAILMALVGIVLLAAGINLSGLFLSRTAARRHEIAVRFSLGAGRLRLARQFWTESLLLSAAGGAIGFVLARWSGPVLLRLSSGEQAVRAVDLTPGAPVVVFAAAAIVLVALTIGAGPLIGLPIAPAEVLRAARSGRRTSRFGRYLVPAQAMLATILLVGAGLFVRTLDNIRNVDLGYESSRLVAMTIAPDIAGYDQTRRSAYWNEVTAKLSGLPGVESVTLSEDPIGTLNITTQVEVPGFESAPPDQRSTGHKRVGTRFVETSGMRLLRGNDFAPADADSPRRLAIVNRAFAEHFFQTLEVVGRQFDFNFGPARAPLEIVGVVADAHDRHPKEPIERVLYTLTPPQIFGRAAIGIRTRTSPNSMMPAIGTAAAEVDPTVPIRGILTTQDQVDEALGRDRLLATLGTFFGGLSLLLVAIGLYGMLAGNVARRTREIGVRMALGARRQSILWQIVTGGLKTVTTGIAAGLAAGVMLASYAESQLFGLEPNDPVTLAGAALLLLAVAFIASLLPARHAAKIDPVVALSRE